MTVISTSGIRGGFNSDLLPDELVENARNFARMLGTDEVLLGRDTRTSSPILSRIVTSALLGVGADVIDYGVISTPAIFRESRRNALPAMIVTASHNEPDWNGLKFVVNGRGINQKELDHVLRKGAKMAVPAPGTSRPAEGFTYNNEVVQIVGEGSAQGVKVLLDLNGGAAIGHAPDILRRLGCQVNTMGDVPGIFTRTIDPTRDSLDMLCKTVKKQGADVGFAFDCDGDRLVVVDNEGRKRTGDYMFTLAVREALQNLKEKDVVISVDTTQAVDEIVRDSGGRVFRSKVGEANVMGLMAEKGVRLGGEGSSGGFIDASFNNCRDSLIAAALIVGALKKKGTKVYAQVKSYHQAREKLEIPRKKGLEAIKKLQKEYPQADTLDGLKVRLSNTSWVLLRTSNTEDGVRVSAEASSMKEAEQLVHSFLLKVKRAGA
ncbi:MAG: phosphomannomutase [Thaumarchaeota archaeon]|nr:phosphomannomutase [Nitrososphaerota archaeon]